MYEIQLFVPTHLNFSRYPDTKEKPAKKPVFPSGHGLDMGVEAALVSGRFVVVDEPLAGRTVDDRNCLLEGICRSLLVAGPDEPDDLLHGGAHRAAKRCVIPAAFLRLMGALSGLR